MREIILTKGMVAIVDDDDYDLLSQYKWYFKPRCKGSDTGYAKSWQTAKYHGHSAMHRLIMNAPDGFDIDHTNGNGLDNRKENLRLATRRQNNANRSVSPKNKTGYKGVFEMTDAPRVKRFRAQITSNGRTVSLGAFITREDAARAYDEAARKLHGQFAVLNFPS